MNTRKSHKPISFLLLFSLSFLPFLFPPKLLWAEERIEWEYVDEYGGPFQDEYESLRWDIPNLIRQTVIDLSGKLGFPYDEGWRFPLKVRYTDKSGRGAENLLAYVALYKTSDENFFQELNINLAAYSKHKFNYEKTLAHELVHAMMNDALGGEAAAFFPRWLNEGLAVFGADEGDQMVKSYVHKYYGFAEQKILNGLEGPHGALDYAEDYLAVKYISENHGPNAISFFIREIINRNGDVKGAYEYATSEDWASFLENSREFSKEEIGRIKPPRRGKHEKPF